MNTHTLQGCKITPLSNYLKALGLLRILSKNDPEITARWNNDNFVLETKMTGKEIVKFLLKKYNPTPIINPSSYDKYKKTCEALKEPIELDVRFTLYKKTVKQMDLVWKRFREIAKLDDIKKDDVDKNKHLLLKLCRNYLPDEIIPWFDAVAVLETDRPKFAPILGSGANDGNFDISENFVKCVKKILVIDETQNSEFEKKSERWLESSLYGNIDVLETQKVIGYNPGGVGGPNSGSGFEGKPLSNPWEYVLMVEGTLLFAGNISKHLSMNTDLAVFPFTSNVSNVGYASASYEDIDEGLSPTAKGELWLPIWKYVATYNEIKHLFNEGQVRLGKKHAKTGIEFARAIITLGAERGIRKFQRYSILKRKGKAYLYIDTGMIDVANEPMANLLDDLDAWYNPIIYKNNKNNKNNKNVPTSLTRLVRNLDKVIMNFCSHRTKQNMIQVLTQVGKLERYISRHDDIKPLQRLSKHWIIQCYDGSAEFRLAASLASIKNVNGVGSIRENLENVIKENNGNWVHNKNTKSFVWKEEDELSKNMGYVLQRRSLDGKIKSHDVIPIKGIIPSKIIDIVKFLHGDLDMKKINDLILPLSITDMDNDVEYPWKEDRREDIRVPLPEAYMIMKLIYPANKKEKIPYDMSIVNMLFAGSMNNAYAKASYMLHAHGLSPLRYSKKTGNAKNTSVSSTVKKYLLASLLFPISEMDRKLMLKSVTTQPKMN